MYRTVLGPGAAVRAATSGHENFKPVAYGTVAQALAVGAWTGVNHTVQFNFSSVGYY